MEKQLSLDEVTLSFAQALDLVSHFHKSALTTDEALGAIDEDGETIASLNVKETLKRFLGLEDLKAYLEEHEFSFVEFSEGFEFCCFEEAAFGRQVSKTKTVSKSTAGLYLVYSDMVCYVGPLGKQTCAEYKVDVSGGMDEAA